MREIKISSKFILVALLIGAGIGYWLGYTPPSTITKVETKEVEKIKVVKEIARPDGTIEKETRFEDKVRFDNVSVQQVSQKIWGVGLAYDPFQQEYSLGVSRRLMGDLHVTLETNAKDRIMVGLRYDF